MTNKNQSETDQAIKQLTDQIAQLSINLAQQQSLTPTPTNYTDTSTKPERNQNLCYYCGRTGHFIAECRKRKEEQRNRNRDPGCRDECSDYYRSSRRND
jgi:hypothetical protein